MKEKSDKGYWYHLTMKKLPERRDGSVIFYPISNKFSYHRSEYEPDIPRTCVAPTVWQCLLAIPHTNYCIFNIYRTKNRVSAKTIPPQYEPTIPDLQWTDEHWILRPIKFVLCGEVTTMYPKSWKMSDCCMNHYFGLATFAAEYAKRFKNKYQHLS